MKEYGMKINIGKIKVMRINNEMKTMIKGREERIKVGNCS